MRFATALFSAAFTLALAAGAGAEGRLSDVTRVRALDEQAAALIAEAQQKSPTMRELFQKLDKADVVAYVQVVPAVPGGPKSALEFVGASHAVRFVLIQVAKCQAPCRRIELLGHELEHATEIAANAWVTNQTQFERLVSNLGWRDSATAVGYETAAASQVERQVRRDVRAANGSAQ